jgi:hypothetical protein
MTKHDYAQSILLALMTGIGGTTVRGLFWLECIK